MENQRNNNNNKMFCSTTQNVSSMASASVTLLKNHSLFNRKMNRLTAVKRLARNRRKTYPKYGPYPCEWCNKKLPTSQHFASHMRSHYCKDKKIALKAQANAQANLALRRAKAELKEARKRTKELKMLLAQANAKAKAAAQAMAMPSTQPKSCAWAAAARAPAPAPVPVPARAPKESSNTKLVVVKHQIYPDEDVKPPPGFQHLLTTGPDGRALIIKKVKLEYYDDDVVACGSLNNFDLNR